MRKEKLVRVGIDTGGTFTDFVVAYGSRTTHFKVPSTPRNPAEAILAGVTRVINTLGLVPSDLVHGTTVATNALLERKGARTALITTEGFEDVIEIGRQARPEIYNLMVTRPSPLVPPELRFGVRERTGPAGEILERLDPESVAEIVKAIKASRDTDQAVQSVAVCLLFSFANAAHEQAIATAVASLRVPVSLSHEILPEYREYERTSTVVINAYLVPLMSRYLEFLTSGLSTLASADPDRNSPPRGSRGASRDEKVYSLRVMQSNGGSVSATTAAREPVRAILSGPAGGVVGALRVAAAAGIKDIITFDMGGTSTDVALCRGEARTTNEALVAGLPVAVPVIDIHTVGAGGGSIARVDEAGALRVGPESAGADPGPACYGKGDLPTVTDANLILGRFGRPALLGGEMMLDYSRARKAVSRLAEQMSRASGDRFTPERAALGVIRVANANMEAALRVVSVERGQDPRLFSLVCFGGAGGLHACELANGLRIPRIIVPRSPGTLSALGVLLGDVVKDYSRTVMLPASQADSQQTERLFAELEARAGRDLKNEGFDKARIRFSRAAALRYVGQSFEIDIPWSRRFLGAFHSAHRTRYGYADQTRPTEIVSLRVRASGITEKPKIERIRESLRNSVKARRGKHLLTKSAATGESRVFFGNRATRVPLFSRDALAPGSMSSGPAIIIEYSSVTLVPAGWSFVVDPWGNGVLSS